MVGEQFGMWTVLDTSNSRKSTGYRVMCRCVCGTEKEVYSQYLKNGQSKSCGCQGVYVGVRSGTAVVTETKNLGKYMNLVMKCDCGCVFESRRQGLGTRGGCPDCRDRSHAETHGEAAYWRRTKEYRTWKGIRHRCRPNGEKGYADRGITVCERWLASYENFLADMGRAPSPKHSIDRIDNDGNYEPGNCRWATALVQNRNRRPFSEWTARA